MAEDDELELSEAFDELLRENRSSHLSSPSSSSSPAPNLGAASAPRADVIRLLHEVFRSPGAKTAESPAAEEQAAEEQAAGLPRQIGRFAIERLLGRGAFGCVYLAHDPILHRQVALKVIHPHLLNDQSVRRRVLREREVMARLQHPNIVPVWEAGEESDLLYIVSEYCPGPTLAQWLAGLAGNAAAESDQAACPRATTRQAARWISRLADAVHHSHERGIVHRDLKPGNVLLEPRSLMPGDSEQDTWTPRLSDFGLAKYFRSLQDETRSGLFVGSLEYASPEQVRGQTEAIGPASDVYSLGVILYELLTGSLPHVAESDYELARRICERDATFSHAQRRQLPRDLQAITLRALRRAPDARYASAAEMRDDLQRFLAGQFVTARPVPLHERCGRWARLYPGIAVLSALCIVFAVLLVTTLSVNNRRLKGYSRQLIEALVLAHVQRGEANVQRQSASRMQKRAEESELMARRIGYSANMRLAFEAWEKSNWADTRAVLDRAAAQAPALLGVEWYWLDKELDARYKRFPPLDEAVSALTYQRSQRALFTIGESGRLRMWDLASRSLLSEVQARSGAHALDVSPDGKLLALPYKQNSGSDNSSLRLWDIEQQAAREMPSHYHETTIESAKFSPDGKWIATGPRYESVIVSNLENGDAFAIPADRRNRQLAFSPSSDRLAVLVNKDHIHIRDLASQATVLQIDDFDNSVASYSWLPNRELLAVNTRGPGRIGLYSTQTGRLVRSYAAGVIGETMVASPDGKYLALCSGEGLLCLQSIPYFKSTVSRKVPPVLELERRPIQVLSGFITDATFIDHSRLVAADEDGNLVWLDGSGQAHRCLEDKDGNWRNVHWNDDQTLIVHSRTGPATRYDLRSGASETLEFSLPNPLELLYSTDGKLVGGYAASGTLWLAAAHDDEPGIHIQANRGNVESNGSVTLDAALSTDGSLLFATGPNNRLTAWHTSDGSLAWERILTNTGIVMALDPGSERLILGGNFETLKIYDAVKGELITELSAGNGTASLYVDKARRRFLSGHYDGTLRIQDSSLRSRPTVHRGHFSPVTAVTQSPLGRTIVTGDARGCIRLWQSDGQPYGMLFQSSLRDAQVYGFAWSPNGNQLAAVLCNESGESEVVCWETSQPRRDPRAGQSF